ncbi:hypothetical protein [Nocardioides sp. SYSU DS0651]|uniref:hypothetical protein n=1 Tax=Nocardioides sp. SYSU DS0651 TaxID=3415955 RepID=UPI003F4B16CC
MISASFGGPALRGATGHGFRRAGWALEIGPYSEESRNVLFVVLAVLTSMVVAGLVVVYVAYPHRGMQVPYVPWLGDALQRAVGSAPVIDEHERDLQRTP